MDEPVRRPSFGYRMWEVIRPRLSDNFKAKGFTPERAHEIIDVARSHKDTLRNEAIAVGPHFDEGMQHLDDYERIIKKYEGKWLTNQLKDEWSRTAVKMWDTGFQDVIDAVAEIRPQPEPQL